MGQLVKFEVKDLPKLILVGKEIRYSMEEHMKGNNRMGDLWDSCHSDGTFSKLEEYPDFIYVDAYIGAMIDWDKGDGDFSYICGMLMKEGTPIPEGYVVRDIEATKIAVGWIKGNDIPDVCSNAHALTEEALKSNGYQCDSMKWCMEVYACPNFTTPDEDGNIILDYYIPCEIIS